MSDRSLIPRSYESITPSDDATIAPTLGLRVGVGGTLTCTGHNGISVQFQVAAGDYIAGSFTKVSATGTTATNIIAFRGD